MSFIVRVGGRTGGIGGIGGVESAVLARLAAPPVNVTYAASVTLNAALGSVQRIVATGDVTVADILNGVDGQELQLEVRASGADRNLTIAGVTEQITSGQKWSGEFSFNAADDAWLLDETGGGGEGSTDPETVRDVIAAALVAGANVTITPSDAADTITIAAATSGASGIPATIADAKGDLIAATANDTVARLPVGTNGQALVANSGTATGLQWAAPTPATHTHAATDLTSGTVSTARLGSGTADSTTFLRGDNTWAVPPSGGGSSSTITHNLQTGTAYTAALVDAGAIVERSNASANTHTIPPNSSVAFPVTSWHIVRQVGAGQTTITPGSGVTFVTRFNPTASSTSVKLAGQWAEATVTQRSANVWHIGGEITP